MRLLSVFGFLLSVAVTSSCTTPLYMHNVKLLSYTKNPYRGKSLGRVKGEDCSWKIFDISIGDADVEQAMTKAKTGSTDLTRGKYQVSYFKNMQCRVTSQDYFIVKNTCYEVSGTGYRN